MERFLSILGCIALAAVIFTFGFFTGRGRADTRGTETVTLSDTVWVETHDTAWIETAVNFLRTDTVRLAYVPDFTVSGTLGETNVHENGKSGTYQDGYGYEKGKSGTHTDTLVVHDSVFVEVPIVSHTFVGDHWRVTAHGYRVGLDEVWFDRQVVKTVTTNTRYASKRWNFNVGAQMGYGYTMHGGSPYVGLGVAFGYTF